MKNVHWYGERKTLIRVFVEQPNNKVKAKLYICYQHIEEYNNNNIIKLCTQNFSDICYIFLAYTSWHYLGDITEFVDNYNFAMNNEPLILAFEDVKAKSCHYINVANQLTISLLLLLLMLLQLLFWHVTNQNKQKTKVCANLRISSFSVIRVGSLWIVVSRTTRKLSCNFTTCRNVQQGNKSSGLENTVMNFSCGPNW